MSIIGAAGIVFGLIFGVVAVAVIGGGIGIIMAEILMKLMDKMEEDC